jgi:hypothetical protein
MQETPDAIVIGSAPSGLVVRRRGRLQEDGRLIVRRPGNAAIHKPLYVLTQPVFRSA